MSESKLSRRQVCKMMAAVPAATPMMAYAANPEEADADMPKVLMPIGDATEAVDTLYPFFRIAEDGFQVVVAGPEARLYHMVLHEVPPNSDVPWDITQETAGYHLKADVAFRDVDPTEYAGLFVSGETAGPAQRARAQTQRGAEAAGRLLRPHRRPGRLHG